jgi:hypothetical protein
MGLKSSTPKAVGILLPFLTIPRELGSKPILREVDNIAAVFTWEKMYSKSNPEISLLIKCLYVFKAQLICKIYMKHLKQMTNQWAVMADNLICKTTITDEIRGDTAHVTMKHPRGSL